MAARLGPHRYTAAALSARRHQEPCWLFAAPAFKAPTLADEFQGSTGYYQQLTDYYTCEKAGFIGSTLGNCPQFQQYYYADYQTNSNIFQQFSLDSANTTSLFTGASLPPVGIAGQPAAPRQRQSCGAFPGTSRVDDGR